MDIATAIIGAVLLIAALLLIFLWVTRKPESSLSRPVEKVLSHPKRYPAKDWPEDEDGLPEVKGLRRELRDPQRYGGAGLSADDNSSGLKGLGSLRKLDDDSGDSDDKA